MEMSNLLLSSSASETHAAQLQRAHLPAFLNLSHSHLKSTGMDHSIDTHLTNLEQISTPTDDQMVGTAAASLFPPWMVLNQTSPNNTSSLSAILNSLAPSPLNTNQMTPINSSTLLGSMSNISPAAIIQGSLMKTQHNMITSSTAFANGTLQPTKAFMDANPGTASELVSSGPSSGLPLSLQPFSLIPPSPYALGNLSTPLPSHSVAMAVLQQQQLQHYLATGGNGSGMITSPSSLQMWPSMAVSRELENRYDESSFLNISRLGLPLSFYNLLAMAEPNSEQRSIPNPQEVLENWRQFQQAALANNLDPYYLAYSHGMSMDGPHGLRRKNATRETTHSLKAWLLDHGKNPYPTKGEKIMLAVITRMTLTQVSTWFANARRRLKKETRFSSHHHNQHSGVTGDSHHSSSSCHRPSSSEADNEKSSPQHRHPLSMSPNSDGSSFTTEDEDEEKRNRSCSRNSSRIDLEGSVDESPSSNTLPFHLPATRSVSHTMKPFEGTSHSSLKENNSKSIDLNHLYSAHHSYKDFPPELINQHNSLMKTFSQGWQDDKSHLPPLVTSPFPLLSANLMKDSSLQHSNTQTTNPSHVNTNNSYRSVAGVKRQKIWSIVDSLDDTKNCSQSPSPSPPILSKESVDPSSSSSNNHSSGDFHGQCELRVSSEALKKWPSPSELPKYFHSN